MIVFLEHGSPAKRLPTPEHIIRPGPDGWFDDGYTMVACPELLDVGNPQAQVDAALWAVYRLEATYCHVRVVLPSGSRLAEIGEAVRHRLAGVMELRVIEATRKCFAFEPHVRPLTLVA